MNADDVQHAFEEMKQAVWALKLHHEDKEEIVKQMSQKLTVWSVALDGPPLAS